MSDQSTARAGPPTAGYEPAELAIVLSHYDLGTIRSIRQFRRGTAATLKLLVEAEAGRFVLKRRPSVQAAPERLRFAHAVQERLAGAGFPLPSLVATRGDGALVLRLRGRAYELFRFLEGDRFDGSTIQTRAAGSALARFHRLTNDLAGPGLEGLPSAHANSAVAAALERLAELPSGAALADGYRSAGRRVEEAGIATWPIQTLHGDWHAGNLLFRDDRVAAVIDFDTVRRGPRALDLAGAALHLSLRPGPDAPPEAWPEVVDQTRVAALLAGYEELAASAGPDERPSLLVSRAELAALPHLMVETLCAEAGGTIATPGSFGGHAPAEIVPVVARTARWLTEHAAEIATALP